MLYLWLIAWLVEETPEIVFSPPNNWAIALIICAVMSFSISLKER